jgi:hypothetical protein
MLHTRSVVLVSIAAVSVVAGCGGSSKNDSTKAAATTTAGTERAVTTETSQSNARTEFIARADGLCARVKARELSTKLRNRRDYARLLPPLGAFERAVAVEMGKLTPPASMAGAWGQIVTGDRVIAENMVRLGHAVAANDRRSEEVLIPALAKARRRITSLAAREGFKNCSQI